MTMAMGRSVRHLFGVPIDGITLKEVLALVDDSIQSRRRLLIGVVNAAKMVNMRKDEALRAAVTSSDIVLADGMAVKWALTLVGRRIPERIAGIDLMQAMLEQGSKRGHRVFLFGATEEISQIVEQRIGEQFPGVVVAGRRNGYYKPEEEEKIVEQIRASNADIIFVAMSPPKKELFLAKWSERLNVPVSHGVGGAFDVLAGKTRRAPDIWQKVGMEWLYRVMQEPRRMWRRYLVTNTLFAWMLLGEMIRSPFSRRPTVDRTGGVTAGPHQ